MRGLGFIDRVAYRADIKFRRDRANNRLLSKPRVALSDFERRSVQSVWPDCEYISFEFYKAFGLPFNVQNVPNDFYDFAEHVLNLRWGAFFLQHKCNLKYFVPAQNRPKTILQKIDGHFVLENNQELERQEAESILTHYPEVVRKIALGTGGGQGVQKICMSDPSLDLKRLLEPEDLIFQEVIKQHAFMSSLNPDSVNTLRLLTLNINGRCTLLSSFLRMGSVGSFVDNLCTGGGVLVGVDQEGQLNEWGIKKDFSKVTQSSSGIILKGLLVPGYEMIKEKVLHFHSTIPYANLIGWDIAIDQAGEPIIIEINLDRAEIEAHQIFNGPVFGDRFKEVREYIDRKKPLLRHAMITY